MTLTKELTPSQDVISSRHWNNLFSIPKFSARFPSEHVVRWAYQNFSRDCPADFSLLDAGSGTGRHALFFAQSGYQTSAIDFANIAIQDLETTSNTIGLSVKADLGSVTTLPYPDETFHGILSFGVLYYLSYSDYICAANEIFRTLKPGGHALVMVKNQLDCRAKAATKIDANCYELDHFEEGATWKAEMGLRLTLLDIDQVKEIFKPFSYIRVEQSTFSHEHERFVDHEWYIYLTK